MKFKGEIEKLESNLQKTEKVIEIILLVVEVEYVEMKLVRIGKIIKIIIK